GYTVTVEQSQWHLSPGQGGGSAELITMLMTGWADAACQQNPAAQAEIKTWLADRQDQLARQELRVVVDHLDLLGLPDSGLPA
ncbi:MAG: glycosyl transferase family 1, partial [Marinobacter sp.]|nr:glycosyl transferase family 1 [Marinobacter sp.]